MMKKKYRLFSRLPADLREVKDVVELCTLPEYYFLQQLMILKISPMTYGTIIDFLLFTYVFCVDSLSFSEGVFRNVYDDVTSRLTVPRTDLLS